MNGPSEQEPDDAARLDGLYAEYLARVDAGEAVDREAFLSEHPEAADGLSDLFDAEALVDELAGPVVGGPPAAGSVTNVGPSLPHRFGDYELLEVIGSGGMGIVYRARQGQLEREVAIKVLRSGGFASATDLKRFATEARTAGGLDHPNIINVHEVGEVDGQQFFSMDLVRAGDLAQRCREVPMAPAEAAQTIRDVADAIDSAHAAGVLHRDLKPANIIVTREGRPVVTDFGLAKETRDGSNLTSTGTAIGTPSYMAPEAATGAGVDERSDVYSLGAVLYELVCGQPPFRGRTPMETVLDVLHADVRAPESVRGGCDPALSAIALKCLEKDPARRYPSARALVEDLDRYLGGRVPLARPVGPLRRALRWCREVPLVAAVTGGRGSRARPSQHAAQWGGLLALAVAAVVWLGGGRGLPLPERVRLASGVPGGEYFRLCEGLASDLAERLGRPAEVLPTAGSQENRALLLDAGADLAPIQASAVRANELAVIAPLYYDVVHLVVRRTSAIESVTDFAGRRVSAGLDGSGMRTSAEQLLAHFDLALSDLLEPAVHFTALAEDATYEAAIVTTGRHNDDLRALLATGAFELLPIPVADREALVGPTFRSLTLSAGTYAGLPPESVGTLATTTFLATDPRASDRLVRTALEALYGGPLVERLDLMTAAEASRWQLLDLHPAARKFFEERTLAGF